MRTPVSTDAPETPNLSDRARLMRRIGRVLIVIAVVYFALAIPAFTSTAGADRVGPNVLSLNCDNDVVIATAQEDGEPCASDAGLSGLFGALALTLGVGGLGYAVLRKQPENATGLLLMAIAVFEPAIAIGAYVADWALVRGEVPAVVGTLGVFATAPGFPVSFAAIAWFLLVFPSGRFVSSWWRIGAWVAAVGSLLLLVQVFNPRFFSTDLSESDFFYTGVHQNPLGIDLVARSVWDAMFSVGIIALFLGLAAGGASLLHRFWRSRGDERQQLKVVGFGIAAFAIFAVVMANLNPLGGVFAWIWDNSLLFVVLIVYPAFAVALLKYRLYDFDVVINKALVYGLLLIIITVVFVGIAFVPFMVLGEGSRPEGSLLPLLATVAAVLVVHPAQSRVQRFANRVVYGRRATPYEALSRFSTNVADSPADEQLLDAMAAILAEGTGASATAIWLASDSGWELASHFALDEGEAPESPDSVDAFAAVMHDGEELGALGLVKRRGEQLRPIERRLLDDLARQAGPVLKNFRLSDELKKRLEQLRSSRERLVSAQDAERRRLERDLHDGAQQMMVALKIKLGLLERADPTARDPLIRELVDGVDDAIESLRDLARGIYPPTLAQEGLKSALRAQADKAAIDVSVTATNLRRYPPEVEAAVYFCTLEALQNAAKYAAAKSVEVRLEEIDGMLTFVIEDDGVGFDTRNVVRGAGLQNMEDRVEALGGTIDLESSPGSGTAVVGRVPLGPTSDRDPAVETRRSSLGTAVGSDQATLAHPGPTT